MSFRPNFRSLMSEHLEDRRLLTVNLNPPAELPATEITPPMVVDSSQQVLSEDPVIFNVALRADIPDAGKVTAQDVTIEYELDQTIGFSSEAAEFFNWSGELNEKWVLADDGANWYFITPDGNLWLWLGGGRDIAANAELVATLSPGTYADPARLIDAQPGLVAPGFESISDVIEMSAEPEQEQEKITYNYFDTLADNQADLAECTSTSGRKERWVDTMIEDTDGDGTWDGGKSDKNRDGKFESKWTDLNGDGVPQEGELEDITPEPVKGPALSRSGPPGGQGSVEFELDQTIGFGSEAAEFANWSGQLNERWVLADNGTNWYFITPDGNLWLWLGGGRDIAR